MDAPPKRSRLKKSLVRLMITALIIYLGVCALVYFNQRLLIYVPYRQSFGQLSAAAAEEGFVPWTNFAGKLAGWKKLSRSYPKARQLLMFHGNGGNAINILDGADGLAKLGDWDVYCMEYPGYGSHEGSPTEQGIFAAGRNAVEELKGGGELYLMGVSLGTGVAAYLAGAYPNEIKGVLLVAPYDHLSSVGQIRLPIFPVKLLLKDRFASDEHLRNYHGPVGMIFAGRDFIVPNRFGHRLYDGYNGPKKFWQIEESGHNDLLDHQDTWWKELVEFWATNSIAKKE